MQVSKLLHANNAMQGVWQGHRKFDLFAERDEGVHGTQRRLINNIYSMSSLKTFEEGVDKVLECFMQCMSRQGSNATINLGKWVQLFAFGMASGYSNISYAQILVTDC